MPSLPTKAKLITAFSPYDGTLIAHESAIQEGMLDPQDLILKYIFTTFIQRSHASLVPLNPFQSSNSPSS